jgi:IS6 family transposase
LKTGLELFKWKQYVSGIILLTVRWYLKYNLSYRDLVEMMEERGLQLAHTTIMRRMRPTLKSRENGNIFTEL